MILEDYMYIYIIFILYRVFDYDLMTKRERRNFIRNRKKEI